MRILTVEDSSLRPLLLHHLYSMFPVLNLHPSPFPFSPKIRLEDNTPFPPPGARTLRQVFFITAPYYLSFLTWSFTPDSRALPPPFLPTSYLSGKFLNPLFRSHFPTGFPKMNTYDSSLRVPALEGKKRTLSFHYTFWHSFDEHVSFAFYFSPPFNSW